MTTLSRPLHATRGAEVSRPTGRGARFDRLVSEWMRLAHAWSEALAHSLPGLVALAEQHRRVEAVIEADFPAEWAVLGDVFLEWESGLLHTVEIPAAVCSRCNPQGASIAALEYAASVAR